MTQCEYLDILIKERNLSRRKLALAAGISPSSFQSAMQRNTTISLDMLFPISDILNVPVETIINCGNSLLDLSLPIPSEAPLAPSYALNECIKNCDAIIALLQTSLLPEATLSTIAAVTKHTYCLISEIIGSSNTEVMR